jgi:hypothetical protein
MAALTGGDKLQAYLEGIARNLAPSGGQTVRVGFLEGATYPNGTPVPLVAAVQEFGAPSRGIPPRPFFRNMIKQYAKTWSGDMATLLKAADFNAGTVLRQMGEVIAGELRQSIRDLTSPPLKPATIRRKGSSKPLVDTGHMLQSIDYEVTV